MTLCQKSHAVISAIFCWSHPPAIAEGCAYKGHLEVGYHIRQLIWLQSLPLLICKIGRLYLCLMGQIEA